MGNKTWVRMLDCVYLFYGIIVTNEQMKTLMGIDKGHLSSNEDGFPSGADSSFPFDFRCLPHDLSDNFVVGIMVDTIYKHNFPLVTLDNLPSKMEKAIRDYEEALKSLRPHAVSLMTQTPQMYSVGDECQSCCS